MSSLSSIERRAFHLDISRPGSSPINVADQEIGNLRPVPWKTSGPAIIGLIVINVSRHRGQRARSFIVRAYLWVFANHLSLALIRFDQIHLFTLLRAFTCCPRSLWSREKQEERKREKVEWRSSLQRGLLSTNEEAAERSPECGRFREDGIGIGDRKWLKAIAFGDIPPRVNQEECNYGRIKASSSSFETLRQCTGCSK